ncbi:hypothetical protein CHUAL_002802 [Chamberlinius hualienensis]
MKCLREALLLLLSLTLLSIGALSEDVDCPKGWEEYGPSCYRFFRSPLKNREQAFQNCQYMNAYLLSVDTMEEHGFILKWLRENDPQHRTWYSSGVDVGNGVWRWQGNDSPFVGMEQAWLPQQQLNNFRYVAYNYSELANRWGYLKVPGMQDSAYICEVKRDRLTLSILEERGYDYGLIVKDKEQLPRAPYFIREPVDVVYDISSRNDILEVSLSCEADGYPFPNYRWFKEENIDLQAVSQLVDANSNPRITIAGGTLTFYKPEQFIDRGTYYCEASNRYGTVVSNSVKLSFGYIGQFNLKRSAESGRETWGKAIYCDPPQHYPNVMYYWSRDSFENFVEEDRRVFVSQDGNLYFSSLENIDNGMYSCRVQSSISSSGRFGPFFPLEVQSHSSNQQLQFPNNFPKAFPEAPLAGQDVHLECLAFGYPVPTYNWTRRGFTSELPRNASLNKYNRVLFIPKVSIEDVGEYICTATNIRSSITSSVTLSIQAKPIFTIPLEDMHMDMGAQLSWNCEAFGIPDVRYEWLKNGKPIFQVLDPADLPRYQIRGNVLTINTLNPRDQGVYQCKAINQIGSAFSSGELRVLAIAPSFFKYPMPKETMATEGGNVTLPCRPEGAPAPKFEWRRNGQLVTPDGGRVLITGNGYLIINGVRSSDNGVYVCVAQNSLGRAETSGNLFVLNSPTFTRRPVSSMIALVNRTFQLSCEVQAPSIIDLTYVWLVNGIRADSFGHQRFITYEPGSLMIYNITFFDFGEYECQAITPINRISTSTFLSVEGPPGQPGGLVTLATTGRQVRLQWTDGATNGRPITSYNIECRTYWNTTWIYIMRDVAPNDLKTDSKTGRRELMIDGSLLSPWSQYEFRVIPINQHGEGTPSYPSPAHSTKEDRPFKAPDNVGGGGGNIGDLTITWTPLPLQDQNAPGIWYRIFYKPAESVESDYRTEDLKTFGNIGLRVLRIGDNNFYKEYTVKVQAINKRGDGPVSPEVTIFSAEARPNVVPANVSSWPVNSTALRVSWLPIKMTRENVRGKLVGFRIKYWRKDVDNPVTDATYHLSRVVQDWAVIVGLQPDTYYSVVAMAFNGAGSGTESEPFIMRTFKSAPLKPPTSVQIEAVSHSSIRVKWRASTPSQEEEPLQGFKVRYWEADQDFSTYKDVLVPFTGDLQAEVTGLTPGVVYKLRVLAYSQGGDGRMSSPAWEFQLGDAETLRGRSTTTWCNSWLLLMSCVISLLILRAKF